MVHSWYKASTRNQIQTEAFWRTTNWEKLKHVPLRKWWVFSHEVWIKAVPHLGQGKLWNNTRVPLAQTEKIKCALKEERSLDQKTSMSEANKMFNKSWFIVSDAEMMYWDRKSCSLSVPSLHLSLHDVWCFSLSVCHSSRCNLCLPVSQAV